MEVRIATLERHHDEMRALLTEMRERFSELEIAIPKTATKVTDALDRHLYIWRGRSGCTLIAGCKYWKPS